MFAKHSKWKGWPSLVKSLRIAVDFRENPPQPVVLSADWRWILRSLVNLAQLCITGTSPRYAEELGAFDYSSLTPAIAKLDNLAPVRLLEIGTPIFHPSLVPFINTFSSTLETLSLTMTVNGTDNECPVFATETFPSLRSLALNASHITTTLNSVKKAHFPSLRYLDAGYRDTSNDTGFLDGFWPEFEGQVKSTRVSTVSWARTTASSCRPFVHGLHQFLGDEIERAERIDDEAAFVGLAAMMRGLELERLARRG
ncbi:hypothetical protein JCM8547_000457 [Rhodosporidiobolus lusitaniae]